MSEWQPIETLPQDTGALLVGHPEGYPENQYLLIGHWHKGGRKRRSKRVWQTTAYKPEFVYTHWMPLPELPEPPEDPALEAWITECEAITAAKRS